VPVGAVLIGCHVPNAEVLMGQTMASPGLFDHDRADWGFLVRQTTLAAVR
jgi:hypothetical protein